MIASALTDYAARGQIFVGSETIASRGTTSPISPRSPLLLKAARSQSRASSWCRGAATAAGAGRLSRQGLLAPGGRDRVIGRSGRRRGKAGQRAGGILSLIGEAVWAVPLVAEPTNGRSPGIRAGARAALSTAVSAELSPVCGSVSDLGGVVDEDDEDATAAKLRKAVESDGEERARSFRSRRDHERPARSRGARFDWNESERVAGADSSTPPSDCCCAEPGAAAPVVVVLDDLHWADQSSLGLLEVCCGWLRTIRSSSSRLSPRLPRDLRTDPRAGAARARAAASRDPDRASRSHGGSRAIKQGLFHEGDIPMFRGPPSRRRPRATPSTSKRWYGLPTWEPWRSGTEASRDGAARLGRDSGTVKEAVMARVDRLGLAKKSVLRCLGDRRQLPPRGA